MSLLRLGLAAGQIQASFHSVHLLTSTRSCQPITNRGHHVIHITTSPACRCRQRGHQLCDRRSTSAQSLVGPPRGTRLWPPSPGDQAEGSSPSSRLLASTKGWLGGYSHEESVIIGMLGDNRDTRGSQLTIKVNKGK